MSDEPVVPTLLEAYGSSIPTTEAVARNPKPISEIVSNYLHVIQHSPVPPYGFAEMDRWIKRLAVVENPNLNGLFRGERIVLAESGYIESFPLHSTGAYVCTLQFALKPIPPRVTFGWYQLTPKEIVELSSTRLHRDSFDRGFPVEVGRLREGPLYRHYKKITGGDFRVNLLESDEKYGLPTVLDEMVSELDDTGIVARDHNGTIRAWYQ